MSVKVNQYSHAGFYHIAEIIIITITIIQLEAHTIIDIIIQLEVHSSSV